MKSCGLAWIELNMKMSLRKNMIIHINGGAIKVDRKVTIEILNDCNFLVGQHILDAQSATTPLRQIYFVIQGALLCPSTKEHISQIAQIMLRSLLVNSEYQNSAREIDIICDHLRSLKIFDALKNLKKLFEGDQKASLFSDEFIEVNRELH